MIKLGSFKPKVYLFGYLNCEPSNVKETLKSPHWRPTMQEEYTTPIHNNTWKLEHKPLNKNIVGCKWLFKIKRNFDESISRYETYLVAKVVIVLL